MYRGVNSASSLNNVGWTHWLSDPSGVAKEERSISRLEEYPWYDLSQGAKEFTFSSDGGYARWFLRFTASGCDTPGSLKVFLDDVELQWTAQGTLDRSFYTYEDMAAGFQPGVHKLRFEQGTAPPDRNPIRQLCSLTMHEYGSEPSFHFDNSYVGAYPTWSSTGRKTYRPTNEACLMRNMTSEHFCPVSAFLLSTAVW